VPRMSTTDLRDAPTTVSNKDVSTLLPLIHMVFTFSVISLTQWV